MSQFGQLVRDQRVGDRPSYCLGWGLHGDLAILACTSLLHYAGKG